jgi:pyridoxamine 5'-phosphate oxidase
VSAPPARLLEEDVEDDPLAAFARWFAEAREAGIHEPEAMTLATAGADGAPSARMVLMRGLSGRGVDFYTNHTSRKGRELDANPRAALVFYWWELGRQARFEGPVTHLTREESAAYFATRPRESRIGAWASAQSAVIADRAELERRVAEIEERFAGHDVPLPDGWGGFRLSPHTVELWQAHPYRLHDRLRYRRGDEGSWIRERLSP